MTEQTDPTILQIVLDAAGPRAAAAFYRQMFGLHYWPDDENAAREPSRTSAARTGWSR